MREPPAEHRWTVVRVGLFFLAAALWLVGVAAESAATRWIAIGVAVFALVIGQALRRKGSGVDPSADPPADDA